MITPKENVLRTVRHQDPQWVPCPMVDGCWSGVSHSLIEAPSGDGIDSWGVKWKAGLERVGAGLPEIYPIVDPQDVYDYPLPNPDSPELIAPALQQIERIDRERSLVFGFNGWGVFERAWLMVGMEKLLCWMLDEPEAVSVLMHRIGAVKARISERLIKEVGVDAINYGDDWGSELALIMGPALWRQFLGPVQKLLYKVCTDNGVIVFQHSDGHIEEILPDAVEMGMDIVTLQPECNDIFAVKDRLGSKLTLSGEISSRTLGMGTPAEVDEEVRTRIARLFDNGGYVCGPAHSLTYPQANMDALAQAAIKYGRIPDQWIR